jgi:hypothetical protein
MCTTAQNWSDVTILPDHRGLSSVSRSGRVTSSGERPEAVHHVARDHHQDLPHGEAVDDDQRDQHRHDEEPIADRVEHGPERRLLAEPLGDPPVEPVGDAGGAEDGDGDDGLGRPPHEGRGEEQARQRYEIRQHPG